MAELFRIFVDVLIPVAVVVAAGYLAARRWSLDHRPMGTLAYWLLAPAFIFRLLADPAAFRGPVFGMLGASLITVIVLWIMMALLLRDADPERRVLDSMAASFGNVGNLGFPIVLFALGSEALPAAAIHFLAITIGVFVLGISASARLRSGTAIKALTRVATTPAIAVTPFAFAFAGFEWQLPTFAGRSVDLLADAMIPVMLLTLGMQLASSHLTSGLGRLGLIGVAKLVVAPLIYFPLAALFGLTGDARDAGLLLAAMPTAVLVGLISVEFDLETEVATAAILGTSLVSFATLGLIIRFL
ncbi:MAG: AEC family transporter [Acidimicrobiia bacterium]|nr:AEC family transporter [Acidimicrobiia bacterium]MBT8249935.1 AEC family transporter [Acidimicrobiia bacterium]NNC42709.1 AEC family transporter [Acidimicrobiia bacterium]NNL28104.1 AEC family transporter [Acidimicrobiia bacterium]